MKRLSAYDSVYFVRSYPGILLSGNTQADRKYFQQIPGSCQRDFCRFMPWNHRFILTCTYVFRRRADGNTYENLHLLSAAGTYCYRVFQTSADKSVYSVRFKGRTFLPCHLCRSMYGIRHGNADLRARRGTCGIWSCNRYCITSGWNYEKATGSNHASLPLLPG